MARLALRRASSPCIEFQHARADAERRQAGSNVVAFRLSRRLDPARDEAPVDSTVVSIASRDVVEPRLRAGFAELGGAGLAAVARPLHACQVDWNAADWPTKAAGGVKRLGRWLSAIPWVMLVVAVACIALSSRPQPAHTEGFHRAQLEPRAEATIAHWQQAADGSDDEPAHPENAQLADSYDGLYTGSVTLRGDGRPVFFKVKVTNGIGAGAQSRLDCGTAPVALRISESGEVSGVALIFGATCLKTERAIRGRAIDGVLLLRLGSRHVELSRLEE